MNSATTTTTVSAPASTESNTRKTLIIANTLRNNNTTTKTPTTTKKTYGTLFFKSKISSEAESKAIAECSLYMISADLCPVNIELNSRPKSIKEVLNKMEKIKEKSEAEKEGACTEFEDTKEDPEADTLEEIAVKGGN
uniref:Uncharacterized protein n=1 Tax=Amphimedon queenslandica TaxID=400682 RepID=A0A1X7TZF2_AMPQE